LELNTDTWPYILKKSKEIFKEEPALELSIGPVVKDAIKATAKSEMYYFFIKQILPYWYSFKKILRIKGYFKFNKIFKKTYLENTLKNGKDKKYCVLSIDNTRENNYGLIFPIVKKLDQKGENTILFTYYNVYESKKEEINKLKNNSVIFFENLLDEIDNKIILRGKKEAKKLFKRYIKDLNNEEISNFIIEHKNQIIFRLEELLVFSECVSRIFRNNNIKFIFSWGGYFPLSIAGRRHSIRTFMIQHGNFGNVTNPEEYGQVPPECSPNASDEIITWGEYSKKQVQHLFNYSSKDNKVQVLGNPQHDKYVQVLNDKKVRDVNEVLNLDSSKKNVVFFSATHAIDAGQPLERGVKPIIALDELFEKMNSDINLIIKLHPHESKKYYKKYMKNFDKVSIIKDEVSIYELMKKTDIAMSICSTTLLESMIFKIPTLQLIFTKHLVRGECYYKFGAAILIKNKEKLIETVDSIVKGEYDLSDLIKNQKNFLDKTSANLGHATDRIVDHLLKHTIH